MSGLISQSHRLGVLCRRAGIILVTLALLLVLLVLTDKPAAAAGETTDLVFLVDGSGSINATDWRIQKDGLSAALQDPVAFPRDGSVAVGVVQWSFVRSSLRTRVEVPLTVITDQSVAKVTPAARPSVSPSTLAPSLLAPITTIAPRDRA